MIDIVMSGICEGCKCADLELRSLNVGFETRWMLKCKHEYACNAMELKTAERLKKMEVDDGRTD